MSSPGGTISATDLNPNSTVPHSDHYRSLIEPIDYIDANHLSFEQGNVIKYVTRYHHKGGIDDLEKAAWYIQRLIAQEEANGN